MENTHKILFEKPDLSRLLPHNTVVDLHFHSHYSDGINSIDDIARKAAEFGIGIAITDHNAIEGAVEIDSYRHILSIPGIEVTSQEGTHLLVYFYDIEDLKQFYKRDIKPFLGNDVMSSISLNLSDIIFRAKQYHTVIIFPHPYCTAYTGLFNLHFSEEQQNDLLNQVDGVEVINSENLYKWNLKSAVLGFNLDKAVTGGSDGHCLEYMGKTVSYAPCPANRNAFLDCIRQKRNKVVGKEIDMLKKIRSNGLKMKTNFRNYPNLVEKNFKYSCIVIHAKSKFLKDSVKRNINRTLNKLAG